MVPPDTWILVCDGAHARLFVNHGPNDSLTEKANVAQILPSRTSAMLSNSRGRGKGRMPLQTNRYAYAANEPRKLVKEVFLKGVANGINKHVDDLKRLIVIAPPKSLHILRESFSERVKDRIIAEIDKDLIRNDARTLPQFLKDYMRLRDPLHEFDNPPGASVRHSFLYKRYLP